MSPASRAPLPPFSERLQTMTEALAATRDAQDVFRVVLTQALEALDAVAGAVLLLDRAGTRLSVAATQGYKAGERTLWHEAPLDRTGPAGDALGQYVPLFFEHQDALTRAYPQLKERAAKVTTVATAVLPMFLDGRPLGVIILDFKEPHHFTPDEVRFLRTLAAQCAVALGRTRLLEGLTAEVEARTRDLEAARQTAEVLARLGDVLQAAASPGEVARLSLEQLAPALDAQGMNIVRLEGECVQATLFWGDVPGAVRTFMTHPGRRLSEVPNLEHVARTRQPLYFGDYHDTSRPVEGFPVLAGAAQPILTPGGEVVGFVVLWRPPGLGQLTGAQRHLLERAAATLGLALERAAAARQRDEERAALDAFARFTEASTRSTDVRALAEQASRVLRATLGNVDVAYSELEGGLWKGRVFSEDVPPAVIATARAGFPAELRTFAQPFEEGGVVFADGWDAQGDAEHAGTYGAVALYPYMRGGQPHGLFTTALTERRPWTEREKTVFRAVGRSLELALERAEQTDRLTAQNRELEARTLALEAFAHLTRDLTVQGDARVFVRRAQKAMLSLLPPGYALYYERDGEHWRNRMQTGQVGHPGLQAFIDAGPRVGQTPSVDLPWTTRLPHYQDTYARGSDTPAELVQHVYAVASLPVLRHGEVVGVLVTVLFGERTWSRADRVILETVVGSLGLALERAESVALLEQRTQELERSNAELEQFAYIASHDLQAPIRAVASFAGIIDRRYGPLLDERGRRYLHQIVDSGEHMKRLVDDLLAFSRVHTQQRPPEPTDAQAIFDTVARRLQTGGDGSGRVTRDELPVVLADAQQLDQLLQNLISNGLKYRREGVAPRVHVSAQRDGEMWRFAVVDNGIGIEPQYFERIFVIFQRLHVRERYEGTGIGLAVCKKIVERHGGQLWLESTPGHGSTFFFTLPAG